MTGAFLLVPLVLNALALACLAAFGLHRYAILWLYARTRHAPPPPAPALAHEEWPVVTVQLPLYNEVHVARRLIDAVAALEYPRDRLEIQVLDDSLDRTLAVVAERVAFHAARGIDIHHLRRAAETGSRRGFKAGALDYGLQRARGSLIAVLDADFVPHPDFLRRTVPHFRAAPRCGAVQMRWGHINRGTSLLTRIQAMLLDGHFLVEHEARFRSGRFFNFNGTAGVWRADAIHDAGGWQHDTLTEDLDLSYRAQLRGWHFRYLRDAECPGELPAEMAAFQSQQFRWAKGSVQTGRKLLPALWRANLPGVVKLEATFHLLNNLAYLLMVVPVFLALPLALTAHRGTVSEQLALYSAFFLLSSASVTVFYAVTARLARRSLWRGLALVPALMALGVGMTVNNGLAVWEALRGRDSDFVRTPKYALPDRRAPAAPPGTRAYRPQHSRTMAIELWLAAYLTVSVVVVCARGLWIMAPVLALFAAGFLWVGGASAREFLAHRAAPSRSPSRAPRPVVVARAAEWPR